MRRRGKHGAIGSIVGFLVIAIILVAFYNANNGDVVGGVSKVIARIWDFISNGASFILSFEWVRNILS